MSAISEFKFHAAANAFYEKLFEEMPDIRPLFKDTTHQLAMFVNALQSIDDYYNKDLLLNDYLRMLGEQHRKAGLSEEHLRMGKTAFEYAIEVGGKELNEERKQHFLTAFSTLQDMMIVES